MRGSSLVLAALGAAFALLPASALAASHGHPGLASAAPSSASQAAALSQITGLSPGQVSTEDACGAPSTGVAACQAHVAILRSSGALVHPHVHAQQAGANVTPGHHATARGTLRALLSGVSLAGTDTAPATTTGQTAPSAGTPAWLQQAYDLTYLSATEGTGDTVAIVDAYDDPTAATDLTTFRSEYGLPACTTANGCFEKVNEQGNASPLPSSNSGWNTEESLDLDAVSSLCPNCRIILVEASSAYANDLSAAMSTAVRLGANQLSASWSLVSSSPISGQFTWPGVATVAATGDDGYLGSTDDAYPAALPGVTAAGGTTLAAASNGARGFAESAWSDAGSGCDLHESKPSWQTDTGCTGRSYADLSADANPNTGLTVYDSGQGGWLLVGGTSLATPLIAAYEAVTGVGGTTPQWAYSDSALLNDPIAGSNGTCATLISYICNAAVGYDGPTGEGSISGDVASGGPGIGGPTIGDGTGYEAADTSSTASMVGGVYPNGNDTTYWWQYGPTDAYGEQTPAVDAGSGTTPVPATETLTGLTPNTLYHYRLVASNADGTTYGYDFTFTTPAFTLDSNDDSGQTNGQDQSDGSGSSSPGSGGSSGSSGGGGSTGTGTGSGNGSGSGSGTGSGSGGTTSGGSGGTTSGGTTTGGGSTGSGTSTGTGSGSSGESSTSQAPVSATPAPTIVSAPTLTGAARVGDVVSLHGGSYRNGSLAEVQFERCAHTCTIVSRGRATTYRLPAADGGDYIRARVIVTGAGGTIANWATGTLGPVGSPASGAAAMHSSEATIRDTTGRTLARVSARTSTSHAVKSSARAGARGGVGISTVRFVRPRGLTGTVHVWVCILHAGAAASCTASQTLRSTATINVALITGDRLESIAVAAR